jgi:hypothetical protein
MEKERVAMTGDSLNLSLWRLLQTTEPDLSGIEITPSGEVIGAFIQPPENCVISSSTTHDNEQ